MVRKSNRVRRLQLCSYSREVKEEDDESYLI